MVSVPVDLTDEEFLALAREAHEQDITFNQLVANLLTQEIFKSYDDLLTRLLALGLDVDERQIKSEKKPSTSRGSKSPIAGRSRSSTKKARK